jgi:hypothetical protein
MAEILGFALTVVSVISEVSGFLTYPLFPRAILPAVFLGSRGEEKNRHIGTRMRGPKWDK